MKTLRITFEDNDFEKIKRQKEKAKKKWREFILELIENAMR